MGRNPLEDRIIDRLEEFNEALRRGDDVCKKFTTRKVRIRLEPQQYNRELVKQTRELLGLSQRLFAQFIGKSVKAVQAWEQGTNVPDAMACRFMDEIRHDPEYWKGRFREMVEPTECSAGPS